MSLPSMTSVVRRGLFAFSLLTAATLLACGGSPPSPPPAPVPRAALIRHNFIGVYRPASATWILKAQRPGWVENVPLAADVTLVYGNPTDTPLVGDWDGDGVETPGVWRAGTWLLTNSLAGAPEATFTFGDTGGVPVVGDWDGDGTATPGIFLDGTFHLSNHNADSVVADSTFSFGAAGDIPLAGDWDGDGVDTVGVYRSAEATFHLSNQSVPTWPADVIFPFGDVGQTPFVGDWNEDGVSTVGVRDGTVFSLTNSFDKPFADIEVAFGEADDVPVAGNWRPGVPNGYSISPASLAGSSSSEAFFPLGIYCQPSRSFAKWKTRGINTAVDVPVTDDFDEWTQTANDSGFRMIRNARPDPAADAHEKNLLAWLIADEPETWQTAADLRARYRMLRATDGQRPILFNLRGDLLFDPADGVCNGVGDHGDPLTCYPELIGTTDWIAHDYYPVSSAQPLARLGQIIDRLRRWSSGKPQFAFVEAAKIIAESGQPPPTAGQFRAEIWDAIIHGARGIIYFPHAYCDPCQTPDGLTPELIDEMTAQNALVSSHAASLQGAINPAAIGWRGGAPLEATWRQAPDGSKTFYVLNLSDATVVKTMTLSGFVPAKSLTVENEGRSVSTNGQVFTDAFGPYQIHVYRAP